MSKDSVLPFELGATYFGGNTPSTTDGNQILGKTFVVEDNDYSTSPIAGVRTGRYKKIMAVRNTAGSALLPKRIARMKSDGSAYEYLTEAMGYADTVGQLGYPIDEFLPAAGVADDDIFYVVVEGMATVTSAAAGDTNISIGQFVIPSTDGKVIDQDVTVAAGSATFNQIQGAIGRAVTAVNGTSTDFKICVTAK